ncbi:MAG TPA: chemotaxis protein CheW [Polyangiaceae bacterium]|nr:chemotaxis protein CheW [Polyangiaceae bacterium]
MADGGVICVEVAGSAYGIAVADVQEVVGYRTPTRVFHAPKALAGVTNLRGEVLPVIDLASLLQDDAEARPEAAEPRVVVVRERSGAKRRVGLKVDALLGLREVPAGRHTDVPPAVLARLGDLVVGVVSEPPPAFALLSIEGILNAPAFREVSGAAIE